MKVRWLSVCALVALAGMAAVAESSGPVKLDWSISNDDPNDPRVPFADPFVLCEGGVYYAYGTYSPNGIAVATSKDLVHWQMNVGRAKEGLALHKDDSYGDQHFWAPEAYRRKDGKYVLFYSASWHACTAVADSPLGPFVQPKQQPVYADLGRMTIDNTLVLDDDGTPWMFHVQSHGRGNELWQVQMTDDWLAVKPETEKLVLLAQEPWETKCGRIAEGPSVVKVGKRWWLLYSANDCRSPDYSVGFATADRLTGPWVKAKVGNPVMNRTGGLSGVGHGAPFRDLAGRWRYVFHAHNSPTCFGPRTMYVTDLAFGGTAETPHVTVGTNVVKCVNETSLAPVGRSSGSCGATAP